MFLDRELTPDLERELKRQQIVIAFDEFEVYRKEEDLESDWRTVGTEASMLERILKKWKGKGTSWSVLEGMKVLDLASGSGYSRDFLGDVWYPQFSRLCAINGAEVVAIDANPQCGLDKEMFTWAKVDLVNTVLNRKLKNLPVIQGKEFDIIYSSCFVGFSYCPELPPQLARHRTAIKEFDSMFLQQAGELLVENGVMHLGHLDEKYHTILYTRKGLNIVQLI